MCWSICTAIEGTSAVCYRHWNECDMPACCNISHDPAIVRVKTVSHMTKVLSCLKGSTGLRLHWAATAAHVCAVTVGQAHAVWPASSRRDEGQGNPL